MPGAANGSKVRLANLHSPPGTALSIWGAMPFVYSTHEHSVCHKSPQDMVTTGAGLDGWCAPFGKS